MRYKDTVTSKIVWDVDVEKLVPSDWMALPAEMAAISWWDTVDPPEILDSNGPERAKTVIRNMRGTMQLFDLGVFVYEERIEITGIVLPQLIDLKNVKSAASASSIGSAIPRGRGAGE